MLTKKQMAGLIDTHKSRSFIDQREWDKVRSWYTSDSGNVGAGPQGSESPGGESDDLNMQTNYPYAFVDTMVANICPNNPEVTVNARRRNLHEPAKYREALINDTFRRSRSHRTLWRAATMASVYPRSFTKAVWNFRKSAPDFLVVDLRHVWFDLTAERWDDIRYLIEVTVLTREDFNARVKGKGKKADRAYDPEVAKKASFGAYPEWLRDRLKDQSLMNDSSKEIFEWVTVYEIYDFSGEGRYYHFLEDNDEPLFGGELPYRFCRNPFYALTFNDNLQDIGGLSDVSLIQPILERLNELDTLMLWFAQTAIPITLLNSGLVDNPEQIRTQMRNATSPGSIVEVAGKANASIQDIIGHTQTPSLSPEFVGARDRCIQIIEFILGIPQYSRGVVGVADVATEVALADTATRTRNGRRQKEIYDLISWQAQTITGLYEEFLADDEILPVRMLADAKVVEITRASMMAREILSAKGEEPLEYDYEAIPYSPTENNRLVQLRNLQQFFPLLQENPQVDQGILVRKLAELLQMQDVLKSAQQLEQEAEAAAQEAQAAQTKLAPPAPPGGDPLSAGGLPPGTEPPLPPNPVGFGPGGGEGSPLTGFGGAPFELNPNIPRDQ
tara:strand:+ start:1186 stop:3030 length:1845 start_codon:yes stop_codon:yes gene_type:complete